MSTRGRPTDEVAQSRKKAVLDLAYAGLIPKEISGKVGLSEERVRAILWVEGWGNFWASPEEQKLILNQRAKRAA